MGNPIYGNPHVSLKIDDIWLIENSLTTSNRIVPIIGYGDVQWGHYSSPKWVDMIVF